MRRPLLLLRTALALLPAACGSGTPPNVVLFLVDDLGASDTSLTGSTFYETPSLERLAAEGTRFAHASAWPLCIPTRAALLTGRYPARYRILGGPGSRTPGMPEVDRPDQRMVRPERTPHLRQDEVTLAEALGVAGYRTWLVGKWHLGETSAGPRAQGFERVVRFSGGAPERYFSPYGDPLLPDGPEGEYLTDRLTDEAVALIRGAGKEPFFLYLAHAAVHTPIEARPELVRKYRARAREGDPRALQRNPFMAAMIESVDASLGRVLDALDERGLSEETIVLFLSDNGAVTSRFRGSPLTSNAPFRGAKGAVYEGGVRVPFVVRWPGVARAGAVVDTPVSVIDVFPTVLAAASARAPVGRTIDGEDLAPLLRGDGGLRRDALFCHFPVLQFATTVRSGPWKLVRSWGLGERGGPRDALYDVVADPGESRDLAAERPERAAALAARLEAWLEEVDALVPVPNPAYRAPSPRPGGAPER